MPVVIGELLAPELLLELVLEWSRISQTTELRPGNAKVHSGCHDGSGEAFSTWRVEGVILRMSSTDGAVFSFSCVALTLRKYLVLRVGRGGQHDVYLLVMLPDLTVRPSLVVFNRVVI